MYLSAYQSERMAALYCVQCALKRWTEAELEAGVETVARAERMPTDFNIYPIWSCTTLEDDYCDDCFEQLG